MVGGGDECGRVAGARLHVMQGRVRQQIRNGSRVIGRAVLGGPGRAAGKLVIPQHVEDAHGGKSDREEFRTLRHDSADQQPTVRSPLYRETAWGGVLEGDEVLGGGDEVIEHVLLLRFHSRLMPRFAILTAPAQRGRCIHATGLHPRHHGGREVGELIYREAAVRIQQGRIVAVEGEPLAMRDEHRNARAIL